MTTSQIVALVIFALMFVLLITDKIPRHVAALSCAAATLVFVLGLCMRDPSAIWNTLALENFTHPDFWYHTGSESASIGINWETIVFIAGMMVMVEGMADSGFFRWLCISIARLTKFKPILIFVAFMLLSSALSMFIDSITVILFLAAITVELAKMMELDPIPLILAEIFCANLGGAATMSGDPPNIIIGTSLGYSFFDFITNTGLIVLISLVAVIIYFFFCYRKRLSATVSPERVASFPSPSESITSKKSFICSWVIFGLAIVLLVTHAQTGLTVSTIGLAIAVITLLTAGKKAWKLLKRIDYKTLLFFTGLFVVVSGLEQTGILNILADAIGKISGGNPYIMVAIILWGSGLASAVVDNIPFAATMIPVIQTLAAATNVPLATLAWALSMGTDIGGSATPIGASANVVGTSIAAQNGHPVSWGRYCKVQIPATIMVLVISTIVIFCFYL